MNASSLLHGLPRSLSAGSTAGRPPDRAADTSASAPVAHCRAAFRHVRQHRRGLRAQIRVRRAPHVVARHCREPVDVLLGVRVIAHRLEIAQRHRRGLDGLVLEDVARLEPPDALPHLLRRDRSVLQTFDLRKEPLDDRRRRGLKRPDGAHYDNACVAVRHNRSADVGHQARRRLKRLPETGAPPETQQAAEHVEHGHVLMADRRRREADQQMRLPEIPAHHGRPGSPLRNGTRG